MRKLLLMAILWAGFGLLVYASVQWGGVLK